MQMALPPPSLFQVLLQTTASVFLCACRTPPASARDRAPGTDDLLFYWPHWAMHRCFRRQRCGRAGLS
jgi:hypothetical protein